MPSPNGSEDADGVPAEETDRRSPHAVGPRSVDRVARAIQRDIMSRGWPEGIILGTEPELAESYGASRAVVREAVRLVEFLGIAQMKPGSRGGLVVTIPDESAVRTATLVYFAYAGVTSGEVLDTRGIVEAQAAQHAAVHGKPADKTRFAALSSGSEVACQDVHSAMADMTGNPAIALITRILLSASAWYHDDNRYPPAQIRREQQAADSAHRSLAAAIASSDAAQADDHIRQHLQQTSSFMTTPRATRRRLFTDLSSGGPRGKLSGLVAADILNDIVALRWPVGHHLGSELTLADQYEVSRAVVREAVRLLGFHGVVRTRRGPGGGLFVAAPSAEPIAHTLAIHLDAKGVDAAQLFTVREALEVASVQRLATASRDEAIVELREANAASRFATVGNPAQLLNSWHGRLAAEAGNRATALLQMALLRLTEQRSTTSRSTSRPPERDVAAESHDRIVDAISDRDPERAAALMRAHLDDLRPFVHNAVPAKGHLGAAVR